MWEPLPFILYGYAVHPLTPSRRDTRWSSRNRLSNVTESSTDDHFVYRDVVSLEVGDEVYAFEKYTPRGKEVEGVWYRGYVVCTTRRPSVVWALSADPSASKAPPKTEEPQQVFIGVFPASHIYTRDQLSDAEGRLPNYTNGNLNGSGNLPGSSHGSIASLDTLGQYRSTGMDTVKEEDEEDFDTLASASRKSFRLGPPPDQASFTRGGPQVYSASLRSSSPADSRMMKPLPPRPSLKSGDDTASGAAQPIIDEIASALREWHTLMFQYLARRDYRLFHIVREHIEALHLGRRQLLAQTLSAEETINMRRDCVTRLVSGNLVQGLDIIVRHPSWGGLITVNVEGEVDPRSWVSAVRMYAMQASLAYLTVNYDSNTLKLFPLGSSAEYLSPGGLTTPANSVFPELLYPHQKQRVRSLRPLSSLKPPSVKFYHVFLDLRAFVASPCSPGETAELFFSLYRKQGTQFVTEEFCAILNHNGVLARHPSSRIRTLFTDLALSDVQDPIYLVCHIVRNGSLKIANKFDANEPRRSETSPRDTTAPLATISEVNPASNTPVNGRNATLATEIPVHFRRPFGCAVLELTQLTKMTLESGDVSPLREHQMPIYVPTNEVSFSMIHQNIISGNTKEFEKSPRADAVAVSIKVFRGDCETIVKENTSLLQDTPHTLRLGFPDVVFPGQVRNELYVKLWCGDFSPSHHGGGGRLGVAGFARGPMGPPPNNVQVSVEVRDHDGRIVENVIFQGSGEPPMTQFNSMVFLRCNEPTFGELLKIQLPLSGVPQWHLFFTFRNRRTSNKANNTDGLDRPFAFAFLPLFPDKRAFVEDGSHTLIMFKGDKIGHVGPQLYLTSPPWLATGQRSDQVVVHPDMARLAPPLRDSLTIRTSLCSTRFTQNAVLLSLLSWEKIADRELLATVLTKFTFVGEGEIVKFLRDIFDSLFGILVSNNNQGGEIDHLVFNALITVLGIVQDRRYNNFQPVLDVYIEHHFNCAAASSHMMHSMNRLLSNPTSNETAPHLRAALKVWHYIVRFIVRSRELQKTKEVGMGGGATADHLEATFKRELRSHLSEVTRMMSMSSPPSIIGTQTIALQHFTSILPELSKIFSTVDLVSIVTTFATNSVTVGKGKVVIWKLIMYLQIVKGFLFDNPQSRPLLVEAVVLWIKPHFGRYDEYAHTQTNDNEASRDAARLSWLESIRLCVTIIAVMLDKLQQNLVSPSIMEDKHALRQEQDNVESLLSLIPRLLDSYREYQNPLSEKLMERNLSATSKTSSPVTFPESYPFPLLVYLPDVPKTQAVSPSPQDNVFNPGLGETAIVFLVLILSSSTKHVLNFLEASLDIEGRERFVSLLSQFFKVVISILEHDAFPKTWLNVNILAHKVIIKMMEPIATILVKEFIPGPDSDVPFPAALWKEAFAMLLKLLSSEQLVIEDFSPQKRRAVWRLAGDIRGEGSSILLNLWQALGWHETGSSTEPRHENYQTYMNALIGPVVNLCLSHHEQLRNNAVHMLYSMIISEYQQSGRFEDIEHELVTRLDTLFMSDSKGDDLSGAFFVGQLRHLFDSSDVDDQLRERVGIFLDSVDLFLELLLSVRALPEGEEFADERVIATLRLMNFIRRIGRDEIYIKYVHQLVNMHLQSQNYVEAALTLKLHSDLHQWDLNSFVPPMEDLGLPQQSQFHRKETLCLLILDYLGKGKAWESALDICKELAFQHGEVTFNYGRLAEILRHQATLLEHIVTEQRYYPDYYLVTFYGSFPGAIRDKRFIYRGYEWEKFGAFCERMLNKHSGAQLLKTAGDPPVDIRFGSEQWIQCTVVTPEPDKTLPLFTQPDVPLPVRTYYEHSAINLFSASRQVRKVGRDLGEEIWLEKTYYTTEETFPTVLRRSQVVGLEVVEISPVENALTEVEAKTKELNALNVRYQALAKTSQPVSTNSLAMSLNTAVDAPLNTGISAYRATFFNPDYIARHPERGDLIEKLRAAIDEQVRVIDSCLKLHGSLCPPEFIPFHETLEKFFRKNFRDEIRRLAMEGGISDVMSVSPSLREANTSVYESSIHRSMSSSSTAKAPFVIPPLQLGRPVLTPPPPSPMSATSPDGSSSKQQTPLQRHLAHLARHGINGVSSAPGEMGGSDSLSAESPHNSFVNVGGSIPQAIGQSTSHQSGASVATSNFGSLGSIGGSIKGRFSRLGSLTFGRKGGS